MREISHDIRSAVAQGAPLNPGPAEQLLLACDEAIRERDEARVALKRYGRHSSQCYDPCAIVCACVCGLAAALEAKEEPGSE